MFNILPSIYSIKVGMDKKFSLYGSSFGSEEHVGSLGIFLDVYYEWKSTDFTYEFIF